jgi:glutamate synthase domain-containing protein 3
VIAEATTVDCSGREIREINRAIRSAVAGGRAVRVVNPVARHNLAVAVLKPGRIVVEGSAGYYCGGMNDGATIEVRGSAGWGAAEGMLSGTVTIDGNAGNGAAAAIRGGSVVVRGDCAARAGVTMKGGLLVIGGDAGYMTGFMMQRGSIVICGNAGEALADSMYEGVVYVGGEIASLGNDAVVSDITTEDENVLAQAFALSRIDRPRKLRKIVAGRKLWNFERSEMATWREAL